jgi:prephenate dehydrogenase
VRQIAPHLPVGAIVTDVGSVKGAIVRPAHAALPSGVHFVGAHPMAGSEKTGWERGSATLFEHRTCFVVPLPETDPQATVQVAGFWTGLGASVTVVTPEEHDRIAAHISHLPQVVASSLCSLLAQRDPSWRRYAGGGLRDTTRIAGSDPALWRTILEQNRDEVRRALQQFQVELQSFDAALAKSDWAEVTERLARGKAYRDGF